jgi:purine-nucleoside phosphorylase
MSTAEQDLDQALQRWEHLGWPRPDALLVSGSGLAVDLGDGAGHEAPLADWLPFPTQPIEGHPLRTRILQPRAGLTVLYQQGRLHSYQGYDAHQTVFMVRLAALLGARFLIMSNAAGGLNPDFRPGDLVLIRDHLNLIPLNPLRGQMPSSWGPQFPDMSQAYDADLRRAAHGAAAAVGSSLAEGVYAAVAGPSYETPAEVRMLQILGADLVGMSTALEVIAARHMGLRCLALSLVANMAPGVVPGATDHAEVLEAASAAAGTLRSILAGVFESSELEESQDPPDLSPPAT